VYILANVDDLQLQPKVGLASEEIAFLSVAIVESGACRHTCKAVDLPSLQLLLPVLRKISRPRLRGGSEAGAKSALCLVLLHTTYTCTLMHRLWQTRKSRSTINLV
jgi:hypothetical protein